VRYAISHCDTGTPVVGAPDAEAVDAAAAAQRLDDAFRTYLAERGPKPFALAEATGLVTGVAGLRLAGDSVLGLWHRCAPDRSERSGARNELVGRSAAVTDWYRAFAGSLERRESPPPGLDRDPGADARLVAALRADLDGSGSDATAVRVLWTADHLDAARRLQSTLTGTSP
jgi:hypothetical protein